MSSSEHQPFRFLDLPAEIRNMVYEQALDGRIDWIWGASPYPRNRLPSLLSVNQQMRTEAAMSVFSGLYLSLNNKDLRMPKLFETYAVRLGIVVDRMEVLYGKTAQDFPRLKKPTVDDIHSLELDTEDIGRTGDDCNANMIVMKIWEAIDEWPAGADSLRSFIASLKAARLNMKVQASFAMCDVNSLLCRVSSSSSLPIFGGSGQQKYEIFDIDLLPSTVVHASVDVFERYDITHD